MGIDVIKVTPKGETESRPRPEDFVRLTFKDYAVPQPRMAIWLMVGLKDRPILPWWPYEAAYAQGIETLSDVWSIPSAQAFFDCLFLSELKKFAGRDLYMIFPGSIKTEGWNRLTESDRATFLRGQGCIFHLQGAFDDKLSINWVPFWQPQSLVKDPNTGSLWRMFIANQSDDVANSISFFSLSDQRKLPQVVNLLISQDEKRSEKLSELVDWFGLYSSPLTDKFSPSCVVYSQEQTTVGKLRTFQQSFNTVFEQAKSELMASPIPSTAIRFLSRQVIL